METPKDAKSSLLENWTAEPFGLIKHWTVGAVSLDADKCDGEIIHIGESNADKSGQQETQESQ